MNSRSDPFSYPIGRFFKERDKTFWQTRAGYRRKTGGYIQSTLAGGWEETFSASFFGLIGHQVPPSRNLISSTSEQSLRISRNRLERERRHRRQQEHIRGEGLLSIRNEQKTPSPAGPPSLMNSSTPSGSWSSEKSLWSSYSSNRTTVFINLLKTKPLCRFIRSKTHPWIHFSP